MADPQKLTATEFAQSIKAKYPDYAEVPDDVLAAKMLEKYPEYRDRVITPDFTTQNEPFGRSMEDARDANLRDLQKYLPAIGGTIGGLTGGIPGAALGGAAGQGFQTLLAHFKELAGAARDVGNAQAGGTYGVGGAVMSGAASGAAEGALAAGKQAALQGAVQGLGDLAIKPGLSYLGRSFMQSAVKPGLKTVTRAMAAGETTPPVVQTLLDQGINVTAGGYRKLQTLLNATNDEISQAIASSNAGIAPLKVAGRLIDTARTFANQVNPQADLAAISTVGENFLDSQAHRPLIPVAEAQSLKQGTYARIGEKYGQTSAASIEAEKGLARGLKEEIANEVPDVSALNAKEGKLIEALYAVGKRVALSGNSNQVGISWATHNPTVFLASLMERSPAVQSMLARGMYAGAAGAAGVSEAAIRAAVESLASEGQSSTSTGPASR